MKIEPLAFGFVPEAIGTHAAGPALDFFTCWGGMPRYWELAAAYGDDHVAAVDDLVLSPLGPFHDEVERLLRQEMPSAISLRPVLDAIGLGAHRSSEIAGRLQGRSISQALVSHGGNASWQTATRSGRGATPLSGKSMAATSGRSVGRALP